MKAKQNLSGILKNDKGSDLFVDTRFINGRIHNLTSLYQFAKWVGADKKYLEYHLAPVFNIMQIEPVVKRLVAGSMGKETFFYNVDDLQDAYNYLRDMQNQVDIGDNPGLTD